MRSRRSLQRVACGLLFALLGGGLSAPAASAQIPEVEDHLRAFSIVPPGQEGDVTAEEFASGDYGPHYADQLEMYASLIDDTDVTEAELPTYFHSMQFDVPEDQIEDEYSPIEGATVYRDSFGIPHIHAETMNKASFALGYVTAEDRMWQMDVLRHAARGEVAEFADPDYLPVDIATRREGYTEQEVQRMFNRFDERFGEVGVAIQEGLQAYVDGINAHIEELKTTRADEMPVEYGATENPPPAHPEEWTVTDTLFLVILQLRVFGETAGGELENAALYSQLKETLGPKKGSRAFEDFLRQSEPRTYTTIPRDQRVFPSQDLGDVKRRAIAIPDNAEEVAEEEARVEQLRDRLLEDLGFKTPASNALLVSPEESATGNPLQVGAPQVGYANPAFFLDVDVHVPGVADFRGPAVPGASALIPLGRGADYAWSLTTGYSDAVDVRVEKLCEPEGGEPTQESNGYRFKGECREMTSRTETFIAKPQPTDPGPPQVEERTFYRTEHGPVFDRGTVDGKPVAFVKERFFWKKELDSIPQFYRWNVDVDSVADFRAAAEDFTMSFNAFYADSEHIGYFHVGRYPRRARGVHPALPSWGTGRWEWRGRFPFSKHPKVVDPDQGWVANWNNSPAAGWDAYDGAKWGAIHRVQLLSRQMSKLVKGPRKAELSDLVDVIRVAATQDTRGLFLGKKMVSLVRKRRGLGENEQLALNYVSNWIAEGAHRINKDRDEFLDDSTGIVIFDAWYTKLVNKVFRDELGALPPGDVAAPVFDHDMWFDFSSYLKNTFNRKAREHLARNYCDNINTRGKETCVDAAFSSLLTVLSRLRESRGQDMSQWKADAEWIQFMNLGAGDVPDIPWQNRGTHNHVVEILGDAGE
ncbi:MAG: penicillin acylase family protein [Actinomycetota bacterium]|nr:penicillin acylase family protein [Actinomycetota bacterium]